MAFTPQFLDELRTRVGLADLVGKRVKLTRKGREHLGLCPFHKEKTPSFTVNEEKGFYHCFGCGAHGSAIDFVMNTDSLSFPEAVRRLASDAGLAVPEDTPEERERSRQRQTLYDVMDQAAAFYEKTLRMPDGKAALAYLKDRGLSDQTITRFRLGFAPDGRNVIKGALVRDGATEEQLIAAGLLINPEDPSRQPYDRFRGRVMFPIADRRGRIIAFGGRILGDGEPKYLNSPETPLFHKGQVLFGWDQAKDKARQTGTVIVTEGYMDVIALSQGGFENAVAPLGTALTEEQIGELWKLVPEPVLCFDGDAAGGRASARAAERVLALLKPGFSLRFAELPAGEDPDSLLSAHGAEAMTRVLAGASPLSEVLWAMESRGRSLSIPEARAALQKRLDDHVRRIGDPTVRAHFSKSFRDRLWKSSPGRSRQSGIDRGSPAHIGAQAAPATKVDPLRDAQRTLVGIIINHPDIFHDVEEQFGSVGFEDPSLDRLRQALIEMLSGDSGFDSQALLAELGRRGLAESVEALFQDALLRSNRQIRPEAVNDDVQATWDQSYAQIQRAAVQAEVERQVDTDDYSEESLQRIMAIKRAELEQADED